MTHYDVLIIGGGIAGLYAAKRLRDNKVDNICILEAGDSLGGRIKQVHGVAHWPLDAGPEFIHGAKSLLVDILKDDVGVKFSEREWPNYIYWGDTKQLKLADSDDQEEMEAVNELMFEQLPKADLPDPDISVRQWMTQRGAPPRVQELADVCYANDFGTSLDRLGVTEAVLEARAWDAGEEYLIKDRSLRHLVAALAAGTPARLRCPVEGVEWVAGRGARVTCADKQVLTCKAVICTVPLSQLKKGAIRFSPPLPAPKLAALQRVHMGNALKVYAAFSERFWPSDLWDAVCTHATFPEFWCIPYPVEDAGAVAPAARHVITAFACGDRAAELAQLPPTAAVALLVKQLDEMFGGAAVPRPASAAFVHGYMKDWSKEPYIEGAYSSPSLGARPGDRNVIAAAEGGVLFFAGEHTNPALNPCMQGAMDTGDRAAAQVCAALGRGRAASKL